MTICFYPWLNVGLVIYESLLLLAPGDTDTSIIDGATIFCTSEPVLELMIHQTYMLFRAPMMPVYNISRYQETKTKKAIRVYGYCIFCNLKGDIV